MLPIGAAGKFQECPKGSSEISAAVFQSSRCFQWDFCSKFPEENLSSAEKIRWPASHLASHWLFNNLKFFFLMGVSTMVVRRRSRYSYRPPVWRTLSEAERGQKKVRNIQFLTGRGPLWTVATQSLSENIEDLFLNTNRLQWFRISAVCFCLTDTRRNSPTAFGNTEW